MANIKKDKAGYYTRQLTVGHTINDAGNEVPVRKKFRSKTLKGLEEKIEAYKQSQRDQVDDRDQYFGILADGWIESFFMNDGSIKDSTKLRYYDSWQRSIKPLPLYTMKLSDVSARTLQSAYNNLVADGTPINEIKTAHKLMRRFYKYIDIEGYGRDITRSLSIPKNNSNQANEEIRIWTDEEIRLILNSFDKADSRFRLRFFIILAYYTGCRKNELLALTYDDITDDGVRITKTLGHVSDGFVDGKATSHLDVTDPKTSSSIRTIPVDPIVLDELAIHRKWHLEDQMKNNYRTNYIFTTDSGEFYVQRNVDRALERYYKHVGVESKPIHTYRHTYGTNLCKAGTPIETAAALMGHSDIKTTAQFYVSVSEDSKKAAALSLRSVLEA